jgi:hypothetical protein
LSGSEPSTIAQIPHSPHKLAAPRRPHTLLCWPDTQGNPADLEACRKRTAPAWSATKQAAERYRAMAVDPSGVATLILRALAGQVYERVGQGAQLTVEKLYGDAAQTVIVSAVDLTGLSRDYSGNHKNRKYAAVSGGFVAGGPGIRTTIDGVRVRCSTVELSPPDGRQSSVGWTYPRREKRGACIDPHGYDGGKKSRARSEKFSSTL